MYAMYVTVGDRQILVFCSPSTPFSEVLRRAASLMAREEETEKKACEYVVKYHAALSEQDRVGGGQ